MPAVPAKNGFADKKSPFSGRAVKTYRRPYGMWYWHPALRDGRFTRYDIPAMLQDNAIGIGLSTIYGPMALAEFEVRATDPDVKKFVENTIYRFWHHDLMKVLQHYIQWGTAVAEVFYEIDDKGLWRYAGMDDFMMNDVQALHKPYSRNLTGARVSHGSTMLPGLSVPSMQVHENTIRAPKLFWCAQRPMCGEFFGHSTFERAWNPWMEKCGAHGAISIRKLWAFSNAFRGCWVRYPAGATMRADGVEVDNQDIAREIAENYCTGNAGAIPSEFDEHGNQMWEIVDPQQNGSVRDLVEYPTALNKEIWQGMDVLDEVIHAPDTGGSWSGRSGPLLIFLNIEDMRVREIITSFDVGPSGYTTRNEQSGGVIRPLVMENFGPKAKYEIRPISLVPKPAEPGAGGTPGSAPGMGAQGPGQQGMGGPPQVIGGNPVQLSNTVELPDDEVREILAEADVALSLFDESKIKRDESGRFAEKAGEIPHGEMRHVGGIPVRRHTEHDYRIDTDTGHVSGNAEKVGKHIAEDHAKRTLHGKKREMALARAGDIFEPDALTDNESYTAAAKGFSSLPKGTRVVSLDHDTHGRVGEIVKDEFGRNRVKLEGTPGYASDHVEPLEEKHSWRVEKPTNTVKAKGLFDEEESEPKRKINKKLELEKASIKPVEEATAEETQDFFRPRHGSQSLLFSASSEAGQWITIGGQKGEDGKRHGGSPVYVENGRITKGAPSLAGKKLTAMKDDSEDSHRKELYRERGYNRAVWAKKARAEGIDASSLHQLASEVKAHHDAFQGETKEMLQSARSAAAKLKVPIHPKQISETGDHTHIPGFDILAREMAGQYPHILGAHGYSDTYGYNADAEQASEKLLALLKQGHPEPMSEDDAYEQAYEHLVEHKAKHLAEADDDVPFSAAHDVSGESRANDGKWTAGGQQSGNQPTAEKPKQEKMPESPEKLFAKADEISEKFAEQSNGLLAKFTAPAKWMRAKTEKLKGELVKRYGARNAALIIGAGQVITWGITIGAPLATGLPIVVPPGGGMLTSLALAGMVEAYRKIRGDAGKEVSMSNADLPPEEIQRIACGVVNTFLSRLNEKFGAEIESTSLSVDASGHEHKGNGAGGGQFVSMIGQASSYKDLKKEIRGHLKEQKKGIGRIVKEKMQAELNDKGLSHQASSIASNVLENIVSIAIDQHGKKSEMTRYLQDELIGERWEKNLSDFVEDMLLQEDDEKTKEAIAIAVKKIITPELFKKFLFTDIALSAAHVDASGHEHKGKGEGGGQFVSHGEKATVLAGKHKELKAAMEAHKKERLVAFQAAKADANKALQEAQSHKDAISKLHANISITDNEEFDDLYNQLDEMQGEDYELPSDQFNHLKEIETTAKAAIKVNSEIEPNGELTDSILKENARLLQEIIEAAKAGRQSIKEYVAHRKAMKAIKEGSPVDVQLSMASANDRDADAEIEDA
jgi:hypothetical protein